MQELIWRVRPDAIVETGVAHGGSLVFYASLLELLGKGGVVVGVDIDIRAPNRAAIEAHPWPGVSRWSRGRRSIPNRFARSPVARGRERVLVILDSIHTHAHVLSELRQYSPIVTERQLPGGVRHGCRAPARGAVSDRPWGPGDNP